MVFAAVSLITLMGLSVLIGGMFFRHWTAFRAALLGQSGVRTAPLAPPAETNVVMLRPPARQAGFSQLPHLAQAHLARAA